MESRKLLNFALRTYLGDGTRSAIRATTLRARNAVASAGSCDVSVCFALEGSAIITEERYNLQQLVVAAVSSAIAIDSDATLAAAQYAKTSIAITPNTNSLEEFIYKLGNSTFDGENDINIAAGMGYCGFQVAATDKIRQAVVVLGSGLSTIGFPPRVVADQILPPEGRADIFGISTAGDASRLINVVGGKPSRTAVLRGVGSVNAVIEQLVKGICDVEVCAEGEVSDECPPGPVDVAFEPSSEAAVPSSEVVGPSSAPFDE